MARTTAREAAMQLLYAHVLGGDAGADTLNTLIGFTPDEDDAQYIAQVTQGVWAQEQALDARIADFSRDWSLARMARVDLCILRLAVFEMLYRDDVPVAVAVNEAVELSRRFSTPEAGGFINGILGSVGRAPGQGT